jgi:hypothetical protein
VAILYHENKEMGRGSMPVSGKNFVVINLAKQKVNPEPGSLRAVGCFGSGA